MKPISSPKVPLTLPAKFRAAVASKLELLAEGLGLVFAASGATVAAVLGKFVIGVVLLAVALGFLLKLKGRREKGPAVPQVRTSTAARLLTGLLSACEVAALVEATNLPVRFDQSGFSIGHWYLVLLAFVASYFLQLPVFANLLGSRGSRGAA